MFKSMAEGRLVFEKARCIFENDEILVLHIDDKLEKQF